jgi:hypothetical protein
MVQVNMLQYMQLCVRGLQKNDLTCCTKGWPGQQRNQQTTETGVVADFKT